MKWLLKHCETSPDYVYFERKCLKFPRFYGIPWYWTKKHLKAFYDENKRKALTESRTSVNFKQI